MRMAILGSKTRFKKPIGNIHFGKIILILLLVMGQVFVVENNEVEAATGWEYIGPFWSGRTQGFSLLVQVGSNYISHGSYSYPADFSKYEYAAYTFKNGGVIIQAPIYYYTDTDVSFHVYDGMNYDFAVSLYRKAINTNPSLTITSPVENSYFSKVNQA